MAKNIKEGYISLEQYLGIYCDSWLYYQFSLEKIGAAMIDAEKRGIHVYWIDKSSTMMDNRLVTKEQALSWKAENESLYADNNRVFYSDEMTIDGLFKEVYNMTFSEYKYYVENAKKIADKILSTLLKRTSPKKKAYQFYCNVVLTYVDMVKLCPKALQVVEYIIDFLSCEEQGKADDLKEKIITTFDTDQKEWAKSIAEKWFTSSTADFLRVSVLDEPNDQKAKEDWISLEKYLGADYSNLTPEKVVSGMMRARSENHLVYWKIPKDIVYSNKATEEDLYDAMFGMSRDKYEGMKNNEPEALCKEAFKMSLEEYKYYIEKADIIEDYILNVLERTKCMGKFWIFHSNGNTYTYCITNFYENVIAPYRDMVRIYPQVLRALDYLFKIVDCGEYVSDNELVIKFKKFDDQTKKNIESIIHCYFTPEYQEKLLSVLGYGEQDDQKTPQM